MISDRISDVIPPQKKKKMNIVIFILMYFITINISNASFFTKRTAYTSNNNVNQSQATLLMTLGFRRYIAEYTVANC